MSDHPPFDPGAVTILNADDNEAGRYAKGRVLRGAGYRVIDAATGEETLRLAREVRPQLVLLDVKLPDIDGLAVCRSLKGDAATASTMVLLISALAVRREDKITGLELGADGYLIEPVEPDELLATVKALVRLYDSDQRLQSALNAARESEGRLRAILDRAPASIAIKDRGGRIVFMNEQCARMLGAPQSGAIDAQVDDLWPPAVAERMRAHDRLVWETGRLHVTEEQLEQADGLHTYLSQKFLLRGADEQPYALCSIATDITPRRRMEEALRETEERLRLAVECAYVGTWDLNLLTGENRWDARCKELYGLSRDAPVTDETFVGRLHPDDRARVEETMRRALDPSRDGDYDVEYRIITQDRGAERWIRAMGRVLFGDRAGERRAVRFAGTALDVTDRKQAEDRLRSFAGQLEQLVDERTEELVQSQERLRALATELNVTEQRERKRLAAELHDHLAQMLVLGRLKLSQMKRLAGVPPPCVELIAQTESVVDESLRYTRTLVADLSPPVLHDFGLPAALRWLGEQMRRRDLAVTVSAPDDAWNRLPDDQEMLLFQSVRELLMNVAKHAQCGEAVVSMARGDGELCIRVRDYGVGVDLSAAPAPDSPAALDSRFGLFSIRERMRALGGSFQLHSAPGKGTTATLTLPLRGSVRDERGARDKRDEKDSLAKPGRPVSQVSPFSPVALAARIRVLLVDDHAMVRQGLRTLLESYSDVEVVGEAADGEEALAAVERWRPSVVVMDINMPKMNGVEATARVKARAPGTVVIGLSVNAAGENQEAMITAGAALLLTKEAAVDELYRAIQAALTGNPAVERERIGR